MFQDQKQVVKATTEMLKCVFFCGKIKENQTFKQILNVLTKLHKKNTIYKLTQKYLVYLKIFRFTCIN